MANMPELTKIKLYKDIPITDNVQIEFDNRAEQEEKFEARKIAEIDRCRYARRTGWIKIGWPTSLVAQGNYISFVNPNFENVTYYARITDYEYVNNGTTLISYEIDDWMTFCFDAKYSNCFVEREQPSEAVWSRATSGAPAHNCKYDYYMTSAENLAVGEGLEKIYTGSKLGTGGDVEYHPLITDKTDPNADLCILMQIALPTQFDENYTLDADADQDSKVLFSILPQFDGFSGVYSSTVAGVPQSCLYGYVNLHRTEPDRLTSSGIVRFRRIIDYLTINNIVHTLINLYPLPRYFVTGICQKYVSAISEDMTSITVSTKSDAGIIGFGAEFEPPAYDGLHPKLYMYPYRYLRVSSPDGSTKSFNFERTGFSDGKLSFTIYPSCASAPKISCAPNMYGDTIRDASCTYGERIDFDGIPVLPYTTDAYLAFLAQRYSQAFSGFTVSGTVADIVSTAAGIATSLPTGGTTSTVTSMFDGSGHEVSRVGSDGTTQPGTASIASVGSITQAVEGIGSPLVTMAEAHAVRGNLDKANTSRFAMARNGNIGSNYHKGSGDFQQFIMDGLDAQTDTKMYGYRFRFTKVDLRPDIKAAYNDYFMTYGCTANRFGVPYVCNLMAGETDPELLPHFVTHNGETFTYVKTSGMSVFGVEAKHAANIANMFNNGVRLLKGSEL